MKDILNDDIEIIDLTPNNISNYGVCGYKDVEKHIELQNKIAWFGEYHKKGLRIKALISKKGGYQGMLEYIPGEYAFRPVNARDYMFIHCLFVGFKNEFKGKGYATLLLKQCILEAKNAKMKGVAVVTRKGSFMAKREIFIKLGFISVDDSKPDFELLVLKFDDENLTPKFINNESETKKYSSGLTIIRSFQCPYTEKNVKDILKTAEEKYGLKTKLVEIKTEKDAQKSPSPFGSFCIILNGKVIAYAPISNTRFENIMKENGF